jgi:ADP-heptose:LPS heptosyltransferase
VNRRTVLAVRADSLGDMLLMGPAFRAIADGASLTVLAGPLGAVAAGALPGVERVITHELAWIAAEPGPLTSRSFDALLDHIKRLGPDEAIVFTSFHQSALPTALALRLAGVPRVGAISADYAGSLLDVRHHVADDIHEVERALSLAEAMGYVLPPGDDGRLAIDVPRPSRGVMRDSVPSVVVHPGASVPARAWAPERARALVEQLASRGYRVSVTGASHERRLTAFVAGHTPGVSDLGGTTSFDALAGLMREACVVVTGNTGPAHLAAAVGTPVVSLFAPTVPAVRWRPWGVPHRLLGYQDVPCRGCRARRCPVPGHPCLDVSPEAVVRAVESLVAVEPDPALADVVGMRG